MKNYEYEFYQMMRSNDTYAKSSARMVIPIIMKLVDPKSVVDLGCAIGIWLHYFKENGVKEILGYDGGKIDRKLSYLGDNEFKSADFDKGIKNEKKYDLAMSLEVAEHIHPRNADKFVKTLTGLSDVVLFSAAIPYQSGEAHVNEQWQSYWTKKFEKLDYIVVDCIREKLWKTKGIVYAQNMFIYVKRDKLSCYPNLQEEREKNPHPILDCVHPGVYLPAIKPDHDLKYILSVQKDIIQVLCYKLKRFLHANKKDRTTEEK